MAILNAIPIIGELLDKVLPDKAAKDAAKVKLAELQINGEMDRFTAVADIVKEEAKSEHKLTSTWRPITMLVFVIIVANNYILAPYINLFFGTDVSLELPPQMWVILKIGIGGYIVSRGIEKSVKNYKQEN